MDRAKQSLNSFIDFFLRQGTLTRRNKSIKHGKRRNSCQKFAMPNSSVIKFLLCRTLLSKSLWGKLAYTCVFPALLPFRK